MVEVLAEQDCDSLSLKAMEDSPPPKSDEISNAQQTAWEEFGNKVKAA